MARGIAIRVPWTVAACQFFRCAPDQSRGHRPHKDRVRALGGPDHRIGVPGPRSARRKRSRSLRPMVLQPVGPVLNGEDAGRLRESREPLAKVAHGRRGGTRP